MGGHLWYSNGTLILWWNGRPHSYLLVSVVGIESFQHVSGLCCFKEMIVVLTVTCQFLTQRTKHSWKTSMSFGQIWKPEFSFRTACEFSCMRRHVLYLPANKCIAQPLCLRRIISLLSPEGGSGNAAYRNNIIIITGCIWATKYSLLIQVVFIQRRVLTETQLHAVGYCDSVCAAATVFVPYLEKLFGWVMLVNSVGSSFCIRCWTRGCRSSSFVNAFKMKRLVEAHYIFF